jgi:hypothetical protein
MAIISGSDSFTNDSLLIYKGEPEDPRFALHSVCSEPEKSDKWSYEGVGHERMRVYYYYGWHEQALLA